MLKDLDLAQHAANSSGVETTLGAQAAELYRTFAEIGRGGEDFSSIINYFREKSDSAGTAA